MLGNCGRGRKGDRKGPHHPTLPLPPLRETMRPCLVFKNLHLKKPHLSIWGVLNVLRGVGLVLVLASVVFPNAIALAATQDMLAPPPQDSTLSLSVAVGLDATARVGFWTPVTVTINNAGGNFSGKLSLRTFSGLPRSVLSGNIISPERFEQEVSIPQGQQRVVTLAVPFNVGSINPRGVVVDLMNTRGQVVATETQRVYVLNDGDLFVGILSDQSTGFTPLTNASLPDQANSVITSSLDATTFPTMATVLASMDVIMLANFTLSTLKPAQLAALETWVNQGGVLIEIGGPNAQRTLTGLPSSLLPVELGNAATLPARTHLLPDEPHTFSDIVPSPVPISTSVLRPTGDTLANTTVLASPGTNIPLLVQMPVGQGNVCYLAFDPTSEPLASWSGISALWSHILLRTLGDTLLLSSTAAHYSSGPSEILARGGILPMLQIPISFTIWIIGLLLLGYVLILGPGRVFLVRRLKNPAWNWRILLSSIVLFSLLSYGIAYYQKGASLVNNTISLIQLQPNGSAAEITTYMGIFVPDEGNLQIHVPGADHLSLAQSLSTDSTQPLTNVPISAGDSSSIMLFDAKGTTANLGPVETWTFRAIVTEQDRQLQGHLSPQLILRGGHIVGTITNTLTTGLNDVSIVIPHGFVSIGHLAPQESKQIDLPLQVDTQKTLASQLAQSNGLSDNYYPYPQGQAQNDVQRHMALLSALSGAGFDFAPCNGACITNAVVYKQSVIPPPLGTRMPSTPRDPLLLANTPATLIGWTEQPVDGANTITINDTHPHGFHDNMLQMPLNLHVSAPLSLPSDILSGHVIDIQGIPQTLLPDLYTLPAQTAMTFEFVLPTTTSVPSKGITIIARNSGNGTLQAQLYNWQQSSWDTITLNKDINSLTDSTSYLNAHGRLLLRLLNSQKGQGAFEVTKPSLSMKG